MTEDKILTESRREILEGTSDWNDNSISVEKSRIRDEVSSVLDELIEIAISEEIKNQSVFEAQEISQLVHWLINDQHHLDFDDRPPASGGFIVPESVEVEDADELEDVLVRVPEELVEYGDELYSELTIELRIVEEWRRQQREGTHRFDPHGFGRE